MTSLFWGCFLKTRPIKAYVSHNVVRSVHNNGKLVNKAPSKDKKKLRQYALSRYMQFVQSYQNIMETRFPSAWRVYRIFMAGIKEFYKDMKQFFRIVKKLNACPEGFHKLTRREIELYYQMPKDMIRVAPMLLLSALPFTNYIILPLLYLFPRQLLCSHFWTLQQRQEFALQSLQKRLYNYRPAFRCLQMRLDELKNTTLYKPWGHILGLLGSGVHPRPDDILQCIKLFQGEPYHITYLYSNHVNCLLRVHGLHMGWRRRHRLKEHAVAVRHMDMAIVREGGVQSLTQDELRWACFLRGLNPVNMKREDMMEWLCQWLKISSKIDDCSLSLLLHCPILLAYNQPTNWSLIH